MRFTPSDNLQDKRHLFINCSSLVAVRVVTEIVSDGDGDDDDNDAFGVGVGDGQSQC